MKIKFIIIALFLTYFPVNSRLLVYDIRNNIVDLDTLKKPAFVIFYKGLSCHLCYENLSKALHSIDSNVIIYSVLNCSDDIPQRKGMQIFVNKYYSSTAFFYDNSKSTAKLKNNESNSLFLKYQIDKTPALLYLDASSAVYIPYSDLFNGTIDVDTIKEVILKIINN
jgi:hypothetical protein